MRILMTSGLIAAALSGQAYADGFGNSTFSASYILAPDDSYDYVAQISGSTEFSMGNFTLQADLLGEQDGNGLAGSVIALHVFTEVSPGLDLGFAVSHDSYGHDSDFAYVEAKYVSGPNSFEGVVGLEIADPTDDYIKIEYRHDFGAITGVLGYAANIYGSGQTTFPYVGASYDLGNGMSIDASYAAADQGDYRYITLGFTKKIGNGVTFGQRGYAGLLPGY